MNLGQARALVRKYINEPVAKTWTDADLNGLIQEANRQVYLEAINTSPKRFVQAYLITMPAGDPGMNLATAVNVGDATALGPLLRINGIFYVPTGTKQLYPLKSFLRISDLMANDSPARIEDYGLQGSSAKIPIGYCAYDPNLLVWPIPTAALSLAIYAVPDVATPVADADGLLVPRLIAGTSLLVIHHYLVVLLAAMHAKAWVGDPDNGVSALYANRLRSMKEVLALDQQVQDPAQVRGVGR